MENLKFKDALTTNSRRDPMTLTHLTAPTQFVMADGIRFAYRRFGKETGVPLLFMQHFCGGMDNWDPILTDGFASGRPVILFDNAGVASSSGETPNTIDAMADHAADFGFAGLFTDRYSRFFDEANQRIHLL
jgi:pimeloyl-ACP methyl ester carboxylesterase